MDKDTESIEKFLKVAFQLGEELIDKDKRSVTEELFLEKLDKLGEHIEKISHK